MSQLTDKRIVVTGAGTGIGQAVVETFVDAGAHVALLGRRLEKLHETANKLTTSQVLCFSCAVSDRDTVNSTIQKITEHFGPINILVNTDSPKGPGDCFLALLSSTAQKNRPN